MNYCDAGEMLKNAVPGTSLGDGCAIVKLTFWAWDDAL